MFRVGSAIRADSALRKDVKKIRVHADCNRMQQLFEVLQAARTYAVRLVGAYKVQVSFMDNNLGVVDRQVKTTA